MRTAERMWVRFSDAIILEQQVKPILDGFHHCFSLPAIVVIVTAALPIIYFVTTIFMATFIGAELPQVRISYLGTPPSPFLAQKDTSYSRTKKLSGVVSSSRERRKGSGFQNDPAFLQKSRTMSSPQTVVSTDHHRPSQQHAQNRRQHLSKTVKPFSNER